MTAAVAKCPVDLALAGRSPVERATKAFKAIWARFLANTPSPGAFSLQAPGARDQSTPRDYAREFAPAVLVLVCGSRSWRDADAIRERLMFLPRGSSIVHGAARGADLMAATVARSLGIPETGYPADWRTLGRRAGILRNLALLDMSPDLVLAFWDGASNGTRHVINVAGAREIPVVVVREGDA